MSDTPRSLADLLSFCIIGGSKRIIAQVLRDILVSLKPARGSFSMGTAAATTISVAGTYYKAAGTTTAGRLHNFTHADNKLTYTGIPDINVDIVGALSMTTAGTNKVLGMKLAKDGAVIDASIVRRYVGTGSYLGAAAIVGEAVMSTGEYIELFVTNEDGTETVTIEETNIIVTGSLT